MSDNIQYQMPLIGDKAPEFVAHTTNGTVNFPADYSGKCVILFSQPAEPFLRPRIHPQKIFLL